MLPKRQLRLSALLLSFGFLFNASGTLAASNLQGQSAPDFALRTLKQQNLRLSEFRGEVVLINFWASWCGACRQAMPGLNELHDKYHRAGLVMLSINLDDEVHRAMHMAQSLKIAFPVLLDERKDVGRQYQVDNMPMTLLIDREGIVRHVYVGYNRGDERKYLTEVRSLLNE
ncbi:MAG: TlpA family protein disulfide reductase [Candidatus Obscuribacterales bacterium]|nr:TlpA family protein disulfide reductase [Steroidobacteraceae bacterium]